MKRTYTLTIEEYKKELSNASESQYRLLVSGAKHVNDSEVKVTIDTEEN